jgi:lipopolysaccharide exporter
VTAHEVVWGRAVTSASELAGVEAELGAAPETTGTVASGTKAMAIAQVCAQVVRFATNIALAWLLVPRDFGLVAVATVVMTFLEQIKDMGTGAAIIQRRAISPDLVNGVFYLNLLMGLLVAVAMFATAGPLAGLMGNPAAANILRAFAGVTFIAAFGQVHHALLRRALRFKAIAVTSAVVAIVTSFVSVVGAALGMGVWALVLGTGVGTVVGTVMVWGYSPWRPAARWRGAALHDIKGFSINLMAYNLLSFFFNQSDKILVGRWLGADALGIYALAQRVLMYPIASMSATVGEVVFPAFSRQQDDDDALYISFARAAGVMALLTFPLMAGAAVIARPGVATVFGSKWDSLVPLIWILAPTGAIQCVTFNTSSLLTAKGRPDLLFRWTVFSSAVVVVAYVVGLHWGLVGICAAYAIAIFFLAPLQMAFAFRSVGRGISGYVRELLPVTVITLVMAGVVFLVDTVSSRFLNDAAVAATGSVVGVVVYLLLIFTFRPRSLADATTALRSRGAGPPRRSGGRHRRLGGS